MSTTIHCPTCGQPLSRDPLPIIDGLRDNTLRYRMLAALAARFGEWVTREELRALVYSGPDGGPLTHTLHVYAYDNRKRLRPFGLTIEGMRAGRTPGAFRLRWAAPAGDGRDWLTVDRPAAANPYPAFRSPPGRPGGPQRADGTCEPEAGP